MNKPAGYDDIQIAMGLTPGGHRCEIGEVEETRSSKGSEMLIIKLDTDKTDTQPKFYENRYLNAIKAGKTVEDDKKWCKSYLVTDGEYGPSNLKRFITAVEDSNPGFSVTWGEQFASCLQGKKVGVVFREEEYTKDDHTVGMAVKPLRFCDYAKAADQAIPKRKEAPEPKPDLYTRYQQAQQQPQQMTWGNTSAASAAQEGFMKVPEDALDDEELPFN